MFSGVLKQYFVIVIYPIRRACTFQNNHLIKLSIAFLRGEYTVIRLWKRKGNTVKKWRSRAWSIDPKKTKITIIKVETSNIDLTDLDLSNPFASLPLQTGKSPQLPESCDQIFEAITNIEQIIKNRN
jgi:hypothetical protein